MPSIMSGKTDEGRGTWQQANGASGYDPYMKVVMGDANNPSDHAQQSLVLKIISSDTNGDGAGSEVVVERTITEHLGQGISMSFPEGAYYVNAEIEKNEEDVPVSVELVTG